MWQKWKDKQVKYYITKAKNYSHINVLNSSSDFNIVEIQLKHFLPRNVPLDECAHKRNSEFYTLRITNEFSREKETLSTNGKH